MASDKGRLYRHNLPKPVLSKPDEMDIVESIQNNGYDTESVSSDDSMSVLTQTKRKLPVELKRENAVRVVRETSNCEGGKGKDASEWSVKEVKQWVVDTFQSEAIARNFEDEEIDGRILLSSTVRSNEAMEKLGLNTLGKKGKFLTKTEELAGVCTKTEKVKSEGLLSPTDFSSLDRLLTNAEKNQLTSMDRSIYNTKKKKITNYIKKVWPLDSPAPRFRSNPEGVKQLMKAVETLSNDVDFTFPKAGLGSNAITQLIRKHMDERRRNETDLTPLLSSSSRSESDTSSTSGENSPENEERCKGTQLDDYFISDLSLSSAEAVILIWLGKVTITDVRLTQDLKPIAKELKLKLLRNKDKTTHVRAIASTLLKREFVTVEVPLGNITRDDITVKKGMQQLLGSD